MTIDLDQERTRLSQWSTQALIDWLKWCDRNGSFDDLAHEDALDLVMSFVVENGESPETMKAESNR